MPRLRQERSLLPALRPDVVAQLQGLHDGIVAANRDNLERARQFGEVLLGLPSAEREAYGRAVTGVSGKPVDRRMVFYYLAIARRWSEIEQHLVQRVAPSIRWAISVLRQIDRLAQPAERELPLPFEEKCILGVLHKEIALGVCTDDDRLLRKP